MEQELEMISCDNPTTFTSPTLSYISSSNSNMCTVFLQVINPNNSNSPQAMEFLFIIILAEVISLKKFLLPIRSSPILIKAKVF